jgi:hypothetical protein
MPGLDVHFIDFACSEVQHTLAYAHVAYVCARMLTYARLMTWRARKYVSIGIHAAASYYYIPRVLVREVYSSIYLHKSNVYIPRVLVREVYSSIHLYKSNVIILLYT